MANQKIGLEAVLDMSRFNKGLSQYMQGIDKMSSRTKSAAGSLDSMWSSIDKIANRSLLGAVAGVGALVSAMATLTFVSAKTATEFESAFTGVTKTIEGLVDAEFDLTEQGEAVKQNFLDLMKIRPFSKEELLRIGELGGQLNISAGDLSNFVKIISDVGVSTLLSVDQAALGFARFRNIMGLSVADLERLGSTIVGLGNSFAALEPEILDISLRLAGVGKAIGMTAPQVLAIGTAVAAAGVQSEAGGTAIMKTLMFMATAVEGGTKKAIANLEGFAAISGLTGEEFQQLWAVDSAEAFRRFVVGLGASGEDVIKILTAMGLTDARLMRTMLQLSGASSELTRALNEATPLWEENIALTNEAEKRYNTLASQLIMLRNSFEVARIHLGDAFVPALKEAVTAIRGVVDAVDQMAMAVGREFSSLMAQSEGWGANLGANLARGIQSAIPYIVAVIRSIGQIIAYWFQPGSPPKIAEDIDKWGEELIRLYFKAMGNVDFAPAIRFRRKLADILSQGVKFGIIGEDQAANSMKSLEKDFMGMFEELKDGGKVSEETFKRISKSAGALGTQVEKLARSFAGLNDPDLDKAFLNYRLALEDNVGKLAIWYEELDKVQYGTAEYYRILTTIVGLERQVADEATKAQKEKYEAILQYRLELADTTEQIAIWRNELAKTEEGSTEYYNILRTITRLEEKRQDELERLANAQRDVAKSAKSGEDPAKEAERLRQAQLRYRLAVATTAEKVAIWREEVARAEEGSIEYWEAMTSLASAEQALTKEQEKLSKATEGGVDWDDLTGGIDDFEYSLEKAYQDMAEAKAEMFDFSDIDVKADEITGKITGAVFPIIDTIKEKFEEFQNTAIYKLFADLTEPTSTLRLNLDSMASSMSTFVSEVSKFLGDNSQQLIFALEGIGAALATFKVVSGFLSLASALSVAKVAITKINPYVAVLSLLVGGLAIVWENNFLGIQEKTAGLRESISEAVGKMQESFSAFTSSLSLDGSTISDTIGGITTKIGELVSAFVGMFSGGEAGENAAGGIAGAFAGIQIDPTVVAGIAALISAAVEGVKAFSEGSLIPTLETVASIFSEKIVPALSDVANFVVNGLIPAFSEYVSLLSNFFAPIVNVVAELVGTVLVLRFQQVYLFLSKFVIPIFTSLFNFWYQHLMPLGITLAHLVGVILYKAFELLRLGVFLIYTTALVPLYNLFVKIRDFIVDKLNIALDNLRLIIDDVKIATDFFKDALSLLQTALDTVGGWVDTLKDKIKDLIEWLEKIKIPNPFEEKSPSPFEQALRHISAAMDEMSGMSLPKLTWALEPLQNIDMPTYSVEPSIRSSRSSLFPQSHMAAVAAEAGGRSLSVNMGPITIANGTDEAWFESKVRNIIRREI